MWACLEHPVLGGSQYAFLTILISLQVTQEILLTFILFEFIYMLQKVKNVSSLADVSMYHMVTINRAQTHRRIQNNETIDTSVFRVTNTCQLLTKKLIIIGPAILSGHIVPHTMELVSFWPSITYLATLFPCAVYF